MTEKEKALKASLLEKILREDFKQSTVYGSLFQDAAH